jgi:UTP--glucose-1-phosphate uridylyltransferase
VNVTKSIKKSASIRKAVFPVAGIGTRFLPATKANPKEMMSVVDKPLIQYAVEEAIEAGIKELIFVTNSAKRAIEDHFDSDFELETRLKEQGKTELLALVKGILPPGISCVYIRQPEPLGLGHAILCAKPVIGNEPFAVLLADDLIESENVSCLKQLVTKFDKVHTAIVAVEKILVEDTVKYGIIDTEKSFSGFDKINSIIEKPEPQMAPSLFGVVGRYILVPEIFDELEKTLPRKHGEIQLTDALFSLLQSQSVYALAFNGKRYDCGSKLGYLQAIVSFGLKHPDVGLEFKAHLKSINLTTSK